MNEFLTRKKTASFEITDLKVFKHKAFLWANQFDTCCYFDSNNHKADIYKEYDALLAVGLRSELLSQKGSTKNNSFDQLKIFYTEKQDWLFGFLAYDLKNQIEKLSSNNFDGLDFPELHFFQANYVIEIKNGKAQIHSWKENPVAIFKKINEFSIPLNKSASPSLSIKARISKSKYLKTIETIRQHIIEGDLYEMNFCQEFFAENVVVDFAQIFWTLNEIGKSPFAAFYKWKGKYLACSSPERFLKKIDSKLISQPIKGTIKRGQTKVEDDLLKNELHHSIKDRAENVMIVDLVRNDLAKSCVTGSVRVEELFGVYAFEQVYQMISTVVGTLRADIHFIDAIKSTFPMGSMTGAPKVMSMQLIEQYEETKRNLYSGAMGYIKPNGDFDFNVVIRSILYNAKNSYLSFQVGGAIVYDSIPEKEYEECLLKAKGMLETLA